jgi:hypothetical protein
MVVAPIVSARTIAVIPTIHRVIRTGPIHVVYEVVMINNVVG